MDESPDPITVSSSPEGQEGTLINVQIHITHSSRDVEEKVRTLLLAEILKITNGDKTMAATMLGLSLKTVYNRLHNAHMPQTSMARIA